jgi:molybdate transport system permease protein
MFSGADIHAIGLSLQVAVAATLLALPFGIAVAGLLVFGRFPGKHLLDLLAHLPLTLPPVVIGYLLLLLLGRHGWLGAPLNALGIRLVFTWYAGALASAVVGFPLLLRSIRLSMESIDPKILETARTLGAGPLDAFIHVIVPLSVRGIAAGSALLFARSLGEFGATVVVAGNIPGVTRTLPIAIYDYASTPGDDVTALMLCGVAVLLSAAVLLLHGRFVRPGTSREKTPR